MTLQLALENQRIEKHTLVILRPRVRLQGWETVSPGLYRIVWPYGKIVSVKETKYEPHTERNDLPVAFLSAGEWKLENGYLYSGGALLSVPAGQTPDIVKGLTIIYEIYISDLDFTGPCDPLNMLSDHVDWLPYLSKAPVFNSGSRDSLFGFQPLIQSSLDLLNQDGWFNAHSYDRSFNKAEIETYIFAGAKYDETAQINQAYFGYTKGISITGNFVTIPCVDYFLLLDSLVSFTNFRTIQDETPSLVVQPDALGIGEEWKLRRVHGKVDGFLPVNCDFNETPTTSNNRKWITHGLYNKADGSVSYTLDHTAANTTTKSYFIDTPKLLVGDVVKIQRGATIYPRKVLSVDYNAKFITHDSIASTTVLIGNTCTRDAHARIEIKLSDSFIPALLYPGVHYNTIGVPDVLTVGVNGFKLVNNFESLLPAWVVNDSYSIVFQEVIGVNLTATVPAAHYFGDASFFAALKAAFELPGANTYTITRDLNGKIKIQSSGGTLSLILSNPISHDLSALIGFTSFTDRTGNNNYTADAVVNGFPATFEPSNHKIFCRVYGTKELPQYLDASQVGELSRYGGVASSLENALFYTLTESGIDSNKIDPNTFQSLEENYALGFAIPETVSGGDTTWKEVIDKILQSTLCSIGFTNYGDGSAVIQAIQAQPFLAPVPTDFKMTEYDFNDFTFEHDYSGLFSQIKANFDMMEFTDFYGYSAVAHEIDFSGNSIFVSSRDLHEQENKIELNLLQYVQTEVNHIIEKYFVTLSERRGFYSAILSNEWILKAQIGREFQITRDNLPGAVENRQLKSVEVQKSTTGATITFEDQKGIQDNSGVW